MTESSEQSKGQARGQKLVEESRVAGRVKSAREIYGGQHGAMSRFRTVKAIGD